ncbi:MAG: hypothetical protein JSV88_26525 [Candidatus Aminicenantes bacterium]|nr:MAG: hypothetical protein JSV88_26525 [Candidatus Aminicenantes bacterium]
MANVSEMNVKNRILQFNPDSYSETDDFTYIGNGQLGCKAEELVAVKEKIAHLDKEYGSHPTTPIIVNIPRLTVITTEYFDRFLEQNNLCDAAFSELSDEQVLHLFLEAKLPGDLIAALRVFLTRVRAPLAVRPSISLEGVPGGCHAVIFPCAGIYKTKLIPNNHSHLDTRLNQLTGAIKFVYASTFFYKARCYITTTSYSLKEEKMAVIIQELVGFRHHDRFYPHISGVARSYNFYPFGHAKPGEGVVSLALGLGKAITDGEAVWTYSPKYPEVNPPFNSINEMLKQTQLDFWGVRLGQKGHTGTTAPGTIEEIENQYLVQLNLKDAEQDSTLGYIASSYDYESDRIKLGIEFRASRHIDPGPVLRVNLLPVNQLIKSLLKCCEEAVNCEVEIEFAITVDPFNKEPAHFGFLQVKSLRLSEEVVDLNQLESAKEKVLAASNSALGNGSINFIKDIIYVEPGTFHLRHTESIADEIAKFNRQMKESNHAYLLIGFGRWGTSQPSLGIPVDWKNICCARAVIESQLPNVTVDLSRGANFFHNISTLGIFYFCMKIEERFPIDWEWLKQQELIEEGKYIKHVRLKSPLSVKVDGRKRQGVIYK